MFDRAYFRAVQRWSENRPGRVGGAAVVCRGRPREKRGRQRQRLNRGGSRKRFVYPRLRAPRNAQLPAARSYLPSFRSACLAAGPVFALIVRRCCRPISEFAVDYGGTGCGDEHGPVDDGDQADRCRGKHGSGTDVPVLEAGTQVLRCDDDPVGDRCPDPTRCRNGLGGDGVGGLGSAFEERHRGSSGLGPVVSGRGNYFLSVYYRQFSMSLLRFSRPVR